MKTTRSPFHLPRAEQTWNGAPELSFALDSVQDRPSGCSTRGIGRGASWRCCGCTARSEQAVNARSAAHAKAHTFLGNSGMRLIALSLRFIAVSSIRYSVESGIQL